ncbi:LLM class F420-dependent oxidoreductase [Streptomyces sp. NEAU-YJ-81]|uniref:LLM class F420-dependent oxidoreductase n=1 Tax=Streptomyces sp. NEAU-YJ-81 TaxID=2820288 RepID=UPI001FBBF03C|nr:LLM class F420-dependent oxidoreductase [Streptomyces sp. NEAU-YJ-81]
MTAHRPLRPTGVGVWSHHLRYGDPGRAAEAAAELDELGFTALWIPDTGGPVLESVENLLKATEHTLIATGVLNLWMHDPADVAATYAELRAAHSDRFLLGIGVSQAAVVDAAEPGRYRKPLAAMRTYLDDLDAAPVPVPSDHRVLAAIGPKMLQLSAERAVGAHPYLITPENTREAREILGTGPLLAPEQTVILSDDADEARTIGREFLSGYLAFATYANKMLQSGFSADDVDTVSDRLVDALVAWGDEDAILRRVDEHLAAGADHVALQVLTGDLQELPMRQWRRLGAALGDRNGT